MKIRVRADIILDVDNAATAKAIFEFLKQHKSLFRIIRRGQIAEERSYIIIEKCYHDEDPTKPCEVIAEIRAE